MKPLKVLYQWTCHRCTFVAQGESEAECRQDAARHFHYTDYPGATLVLPNEGR